MALGAATPDKARVRRDARVGARVEGAYQTALAYTGYFRCRYTPARESESRDQGGVRRVKPATLLVTRSALAAHGVGSLKASDRVEVVPVGGLQAILMEVQGEPTPIRKRRTVIGYEAELAKVRDSEAPNVVA